MLLIVPVGIEISFALLYSLRGYILLIVPVGIEIETAYTMMPIEEYF